MNAETVEANNARRYRDIPVELLRPGRWQPRRVFRQEDLQELAAAIKEIGVVQPLNVRAAPNEEGFEIVTGERRWRAAGLAQLHEVPCLVRDEWSERDCLITAGIENLQREDLNPIEEADLYLRMIEELDVTHDQVAEAMGVSRVRVTNTLRLLRLDDSVQALLNDGALQAGHGKVLAGLKIADQRALAELAVKTGMSVRELERRAEKIRNTSKPSTVKQARRSSDIETLERELSGLYGTPVRVEWNRGRGRFEFPFTSLDQAEGILERLRGQTPNENFDD